MDDDLKYLDTWHKDEITCPYCKHEQTDAWEFEDGEHQCGECEKEFNLTINHTVTYTTTPKERENE